MRDPVLGVWDTAPNKIGKSLSSLRIYMPVGKQIANKISTNKLHSISYMRNLRQARGIENIWERRGFCV